DRDWSSDVCSSDLIDLQRRSIGRLGPGPVAPSLEEQAEVRLRRRQAGIVFQGAPERAFRLLQISRTQVEGTQVVARLRQARIDRQGPLEGRGGFFDLAAQQQRSSEGIPGG